MHNTDSHAYWNQRAEGYSEVNREELEGVQRRTWKKLLDREIRKNYPDRAREDISILDIGAGPGFLSIILSELGYSVCAADYSEEMLAYARENAANCQAEVVFCQENAEDLTFDDHNFDVVVSRNLTWNLPHVEKAYQEWLRVLKPGGLMMVFDANWYSYLRDEESRKGYEADREKAAEAGLGDYNVGENFDQMEEIADRLPMTDVIRPEWDADFLREQPVKELVTHPNIGEEVYSEKEKINYGSTPMFMIRAVKA